MLAIGHLVNADMAPLLGSDVVQSTRRGLGMSPSGRFERYERVVTRVGGEVRLQRLKGRKIYSKISMIKTKTKQDQNETSTLSLK